MHPQEYSNYYRSLITLTFKYKKKKEIFDGYYYFDKEKEQKRIKALFSNCISCVIIDIYVEKPINEQIIP